MKGGYVMENIKVLWMNNGDESLLHFIEDGKSHGLDIFTCRNITECFIKLNSNIASWEAIIINADCRIREEKPKIGNLSNAIKRLRTNYRDIPRFVAVNDEKLTYNVRTRLKDILEEEEEYGLLQPSASSLFESIRTKVDNTPEAIVRKRHSKVLRFLPEARDKLVRLLIKLESHDITCDSDIPNVCRKILEKLQKSELFNNVYISNGIYEGLKNKHKNDGDYKFATDVYNKLSPTDFSYAFGLAQNVPLHVKRSIFACTSIVNPGSHDSKTDILIEQGKAPYATRALIYELLNVLYWCEGLDKETFELRRNKLLK